MKVWLPKNYSSKRRYPVLFDIGGADYDAWIAQVAAYYSGAFDRIPPVIVVGVYPGALDEVGFSYETGEVNQTGSRFVRFLLEDVLPCLQRNYHFADFKAIIGHSYLANYTDYFLKHHPDLFQGYVLLAPEQPEYRLDLAALVSHLPQPTYY